MVEGLHVICLISLIFSTTLVVAKRRTGKNTSWGDFANIEQEIILRGKPLEQETILHPGANNDKTNGAESICWVCPWDQNLGPDAGRRDNVSLASVVFEPR